jgi:hypothetical protein
MSMNEQEKENGLPSLKLRLSDFVSANAISQFESDDIIELVNEGESVIWIVDQLKNNNPNINEEAISNLLTEIKALIRPEQEQPQQEDKESEESPETAAAPDALDALAKLDIDPAELDQINLKDILPPGVKLPPNISAKDIKAMLQSPQGMVVTDFVTFCQEKGIDPDAASMDDPQMQELNKEWMSTPREAFDGKTPAQMMGKVETFRRENPRVGRNDPCPCGSGKKYKKCCGRS